MSNHFFYTQFDVPTASTIAKNANPPRLFVDINHLCFCCSMYCLTTSNGAPPIVDTK